MPSELGLYRDAQAAYAEVLRRGIKPDHLVIHGYSLGGAVACNQASRKPCAGLVLQSTFTSLEAMAHLRYGGVMVEPARGHFASDQRLDRIHCPLLVIHGQADATVPCTMGRSLYERARASKKELWLVPTAGHTNLEEVAGPAYFDKLATFVRNATATVPR